ncbi:hypothetical protein VD0002_g4289 [Verticillium dahliae]|uniref:Uncharacterized protein n=1 Tax=Verticillium dahliae TaxID=27337 RepID=A0AA45ARH3_VERDA|nr:hypothetical protein BJF96_g468 [Verticillium dahliae]PNH51380.1 hypothetical protein VD0003_g5855 [Verticillium dahliae]PNH64383.1 hypothetical protein VD0002_g4289 [Verticillium dahliae]
MAGRGKAGIPHPTPLLPTYVEGHWHLPKPTINGVSPVTGLPSLPLSVRWYKPSHHGGLYRAGSVSGDDG